MAKVLRKTRTELTRLIDGLEGRVDTLTVVAPAETDE
jgi:hypothetical protein